MGEFGETDFVNLERGAALCRVGQRQNTFRLSTQPPDRVESGKAQVKREHVRSSSLAKYGRKRDRDAETPKAITSTATRTQNKAPPGRGGQQHKYLQGLIKRAAEERGFEVTVEKRILGGHGHVDVALSLGNISVACEISISTGIEHELDNISKCLAAGYSRVVLVSSEEKILQAVEERLIGDLSSDAFGRLRFLTPTMLIAFIDEVRIEASRHIGAAPTASVPQSASSPKAKAKLGAPPIVPSDREAMLDVEQASTHVRRAAQTLAKLRCVGGGPVFYKIGRNVYYKRADLDDWLAVRRKTSTSSVTGAAR